MSSPLFTAIADAIEKNLTQIILKPMESILGSKISKDLTQAFLHREQFSTAEKCMPRYMSRMIL
ncbi:hypothetical protein AB9K21_02525 [Anaplasma phagocytophilum]|uniref:Uncharacterized protein n=1 Tax=Anaplasma phagocytophilum str. ApNP TaxID=1359153 RepID=A0A0F3NH71_ANAPH|nr:hypothetical protein APHNP_0066 [Anaplasma phagocytophilum str. ApNP]